MKGAPVLTEAITGLLIALASLVMAPGARASTSSASPADARTGASANLDAPHIRARGDRFEIWSGSKVKPIFFRGVNLGAGAPGHFPGEFALTKPDYRRYIQF